MTLGNLPINEAVTRILNVEKTIVSIDNDKGTPPPQKDFKAIVEELNDTRPISVKDDPQKYRWGMKSKASGYSLTAAVTYDEENSSSELQRSRYTVALSVKSPKKYAKR
ncbi:MAG: hypothetical protein WDO15_06190 [Bacteroidota bacterium]